VLPSARYGTEHSTPSWRNQGFLAIAPSVTAYNTF
jgi:hypothetical protein